MHKIKNQKGNIYIIILGVTAFLLIGLSASFFIFQKVTKQAQNQENKIEQKEKISTDSVVIGDIEIPLPVGWSFVKRNDNKYEFETKNYILEGSKILLEVRQFGAFTEQQEVLKGDIIRLDNKVEIFQIAGIGGPLFGDGIIANSDYYELYWNANDIPRDGVPLNNVSLSELPSGPMYKNQLRQDILKIYTSLKVLEKSSEYSEWIEVVGKVGSHNITMKYPNTWISNCADLGRTCYVSNIEPYGSFTQQQNMCLYRYINWRDDENDLENLRVNNMSDHASIADCNQKIQLIQDSIKIFSSQNKKEIDWKTYKNEKYDYKFELKYPGDFSINNASSQAMKLFNPNHSGITIYDISDNEGNVAWVELVDIKDFKWSYVHGYEESSYLYFDIENKIFIDMDDNATQIPKGYIGYRPIYKLGSGCCDGSGTVEYLIVDYVKNKVLIFGYNDDGVHFEQKNEFNNFIDNIDKIVSSINYY